MLLNFVRELSEITEKEKERKKEKEKRMAVDVLFPSLGTPAAVVAFGSTIRLLCTLL